MGGVRLYTHSQNKHIMAYRFLYRMKNFQCLLALDGSCFLAFTSKHAEEILRLTRIKTIKDVDDPLMAAAAVVMKADRLFCLPNIREFDPVGVL